MADNLKINQEINEVLKARQVVLEVQSKELSKQVALANGLLTALKGASFEETLTKIRQTRDALEELSHETEKTGLEFSDYTDDLVDNLNAAEKATTGLTGVTKDAGRQFIKWGKIGSSVFTSMQIGFRTLVGSLKSAVSLTKTLVTSFYQIGKSIIAIPFKIFSGLIEASFEWWERVKAVAEATEDVRRTFGDLASNEGAAIMDSFKSLNGEVANTGLSIGQLFNTMENNADVLKHFTELAKGMGAAFNLLSENMAKNSGYVLAYQRGLGLTSEQMGDIGQRAIASGDDMTEQLREISNYSLKMGKRFGIAQKMISGDIAEMMSDMSNFGGVGRESMSSLSVFSRKLGVDFKKLLGVVKQFDDFESAAENAAKLGQAFGMNIDATKMMMEQDPGKRVDMIRKSFKEAGRSFEGMSRQERALLAQTAGIEEGIADQVFSQKNLGLSYDDIKNGAKAAGKQQLTQEQATQQLAKSIDRVVVSLEKVSSLWEMFTNSVFRGITRTQEWNVLMAQIQKTLWAVFKVGNIVGGLFVSIFPGVKALFGTTTDFFVNIEKRVEGVTGIFREFFEELGDSSKAAGAFGKFIERIKSLFIGGHGLDGFLKNEGLKAMTRAFSYIGAGIVDLIREGLHGLANFVKGDLLGMTDKVSGIVADQAPSMMKDMFGPLIDALGRLWNDEALIKKTLEAGIELFSIVTTKIGKVLADNPKIAMAIGGILFGPAMLKAGLSFLGTMLLQEATWTFLTEAVTASGAGSQIAAALFNPYTLIAAAIAALGVASVGIDKGMKEFSEKLVGGVFDSADIAVGAGIAGVLDLITFGLLGGSTGQMIAKCVAEAFKDAFEQLGNLLGPSFAAGLKDTLGKGFELLGSLGGLLSSLFGDDDAAIEAAASVFIDKLGNYLLTFLTKYLPQIPIAVVGTLIKLASSVHQIMLKITSKIFKLIGGVLKGIGDLIAKIPGVGPAMAVPLRLVGEFFTQLGNVFEFVSTMLGSLKDAFTKVWDFIGLLTEGLGALFGSSDDQDVWIKKFEEKWTGLKTWFTNDFVKGIENAFNSLIRKIGEGILELINKLPSGEWIGKKLGVFGTKEMMQGQGALAGKNAAAAMKGGTSTPTGAAIVASAPSEISRSLKGDNVVELCKMMAQNTEAHIASKTGTIDLTARLDKVEGTMMAAKKQLTIDKQGYAVNITLNVTMDADTVATTLLETKMIQGTGVV